MDDMRVLFRFGLVISRGETADYTDQKVNRKQCEPVLVGGKFELFEI